MTPQQTTLMNSRRRPGLHPAAICLVAIMSILTAIKPGHSATLNPKSTPEKPQLWLYYSTNLLVNANVQRIRRIWSRARAEGYSHILLSDSKLAHLNNLGSIAQQYQRNVVRVRKLAARLGLVLVPSLFPIGYSNDILYDNPSLAEGLPVRDAPFVVENQIATPQPDPKISLGRRPTWKDSDIQLRNGTATLHNPPGNARLVFERTLHPFREYHIRVFIRTTQFTGRPRIAVLAGHSGRGLQYEALSVRPSQNWTRNDVVFDTLNHRHVTIYFGVWGSARGTLQWKQWSLSPAGLVNVLSRPGAPTSVAGYTSGGDYQPIVDRKLGNRPWPGEYTAWHKPIRIHFIRPIANGTIVRVSWYFPPIFYHGQVAACMASRQFRKLLAANAQSVRAAFHSGHYMMEIDENRVLNWDLSCRRLHATPGGILANTTRYCRRLLHGAKIYTWSDMFDPYHNAHGHYYLVHGSYAGSWKGLGRRTIVMNWNGGHKRKSLQFFARLGNRQIIAAYYDAPLSQTASWIAAAKPVRGVIGYMYTTWDGDYRQMGAFAALVKRAYQPGGK